MNIYCGWNIKFLCIMNNIGTEKINLWNCFIVIGNDTGFLQCIL